MSAESDLNTVLRNLNAVVVEMSDAGREAAQEIAALLEDYAKANHPWQSDTGRTQMTTEGIVEEVNGVIEVMLTTGTDYSYFLELARGGKFAWLFQAMDSNRDNITHILREKLGRGRREPL